MAELVEFLEVGLLESGQRLGFGLVARDEFVHGNQLSIVGVSLAYFLRGLLEAELGVGVFRDHRLPRKLVTLRCAVLVEL